MILIFGGAYQGKLEYAKYNYNLSDSEVFSCGESLDLDLSAKVINNLQEFVYACVLKGMEAKDVLAGYGHALDDKIIIIDDISQGIVPMEADRRNWREMTGRTMLYLGKEADTVIRVFCGLGQKIK